jgi:carboxyl-terminal processing protease
VHTERIAPGKEERQAATTTHILRPSWKRVDRLWGQWNNPRTVKGSGMITKFATWPGGRRPLVVCSLCAALFGGCATPPAPLPTTAPGDGEAAPVEQAEVTDRAIVTNLLDHLDPVTVADENSAYPDIELLAEALLNVRKFYVEEKSYREITLGAIHGMLHALDPHSSFLEVEEFTEMQEDTAGKFSGIGIHIGVRDGALTVIAPIEDTPGFRAGLQSGDRIVEIEGEKTGDLTLREAVTRLRGEKGTKVVITIQRPREDDTREIEITRDDIVVPSVKSARIIRENIGYLRITQFARPTADAVQEHLDYLLGQGMDALVLDLRNNPGGLLKSAVDVAQKFLPADAVIVTTRGRPGVQDEVVARARGTAHHTEFPLAILVNGGSASASEIVAGALKDHSRAVLVGTTTFGKGSVQSVMPISANQDMAVRLTIAYYYTPSGSLIHGKGIDPDVEVDMSPQQWRAVLMKRAQTESPGVFTEDEKREFADAADIQLERAVDLLHAIKIFK